MNKPERTHKYKQIMIAYMTVPEIMWVDVLEKCILFTKSAIYIATGSMFIGKTVAEILFALDFRFFGECTSARICVQHDYGS